PAIWHSTSRSVVECGALRRFSTRPTSITAPNSQRPPRRLPSPKRWLSAGLTLPQSLRVNRVELHNRVPRRLKCSCEQAAVALMPRLDSALAHRYVVISIDGGI